MAKTYSNRKLGATPGELIKDTYNYVNLNSDELNADLDELYSQDAVLGQQLTDIIEETALDPNKDPEVTNARTSASFEPEGGGAFPTVKDRLDYTDAIVSQVSSIDSRLTAAEDYIDMLTQYGGVAHFITWDTVNAASVRGGASAHITTTTTNFGHFG
ncbi:MAG: hypothetical protein PHX43_03785, partial [Alphaproteobacteria bacterium]|nr:hypothetical protein [Alphaproteobacteria bacterium]